MSLATGVLAALIAVTLRREPTLLIQDSIGQPEQVPVGDNQPKGHQEMRLKAKVLLVAAIAIASPGSRGTTSGGRRATELFDGRRLHLVVECRKRVQRIPAIIQYKHPGHVQQHRPREEQHGIRPQQGFRLFLRLFLQRTFLWVVPGGSPALGVSWVKIGTSIESFRSITTECFA